MALYDWRCTNKKCKHEFEESVPMAEFDTKKVYCPKCKKLAERKLTAQRATHSTWKHWRT